MPISLKLAKSLYQLGQLSPLATPLVRYASIMRCKQVTCLNQNKPVMPISFAKAVTPVNQLCSGEIMRCFSNRGNCKEVLEPRCSLENIRKSKCYKLRSRKQKKRKEEKPKEFMKAESNMTRSMWANPECCHGPCHDMLPRFDDLYYSISDKTRRQYVQTWAECPEQIVKPKLCCFDKLLEPPFQKREPSDRPNTACPDKKIMECHSHMNKKCPRTVIPNCRLARHPPKCRSDRKPAKCRKVCTPRPSFSECLRPKPKNLRTRECNCAGLRPMCQVWEHWRKRIMLKAKKLPR